MSTHPPPDTRHSTPGTPNILAVGLNPAYQRTLVLDALVPGAVHRAKREIQAPGGKAVHFTMAANAVAPGSTTGAFFTGGDTGEFIRRKMVERDCDLITVELADDTRTCTTLLDQASGEATEVISPSAPIPAEAVAEIRKRLLAAVAKSDGLAFCGTYPPGVTEEFFVELAEANGDKPLMVDAYGGIGQLLRSGHIDVLKINLDEARELTGAEDPKSIRDVVFSTYVVGGLLITDGAREAYAFDRSESWELSVPTIDAVNPIGAGDVCAGVTMVEILRGLPLVEAFASGLTAASASCLTYEGGVFDLDAMQTLRQDVVVKTL